jgi:hypothetical protein
MNSIAKTTIREANKTVAKVAELQNNIDSISSVTKKIDFINQVIPDLYISGNSIVDLKNHSLISISEVR